MAKSPDTFTCELGTFQFACSRKPEHGSSVSLGPLCQIQTTEGGQLHCTACGETIEPIPS